MSTKIFFIKLYIDIKFDQLQRLYNIDMSVVCLNFQELECCLENFCDRHEKDKLFWKLSNFRFKTLQGVFNVLRKFPSFIDMVENRYRCSDRCCDRSTYFQFNHQPDRFSEMKKLSILSYRLIGVFNKIDQKYHKKKLTAWGSPGRI